MSSLCSLKEQYLTLRYEGGYTEMRLYPVETVGVVAGFSGTVQSGDKGEEVARCQKKIM